MAEEDKAMPSFSTETEEDDSQPTPSREQKPNLFGLCQGAKEEDDSQPTTSREHYQTCLNIAEARRRKAKPNNNIKRKEQNV